MVLTILEAQVTAEKAPLLEAAYQQETQHQLDPGIVQTFLVQSAADPERWQILTFWENRAALDAMRASGETPRGVVIFRAASAEPKLSVHRVAANAAA